MLQKSPLATGTALDRAGDQLERLRKAAVKKQIQLHKSEVKDWAAKAVLGRAKQAHQYLKRQEGVPVRPFQQLPFRDGAEALRPDDSTGLRDGEERLLRTANSSTRAYSQADL